MDILFTLLVLLADIPAGFYDTYCSKETVDSVYAECMAEAKAEYDQDAEVAASYYMADWAYNVSLLDLSDYFITDALEADTGDQVLRADCLSMASALARLRGDLAGAIQYAEECLEIDRASGNQENISSSLNNIAGLYLTYGDPETSLKYIDEAIEVEEPLGRSAYLAVRYGVASEIYLKLGELPSALEFADKALQLDLEGERVEKIAVRRSQKAAVLMEMGDYAEAEVQLKMALPVFEEYNSLNSLAITYAQLGEIAAIRYDTAAASEAFGKSVSVSRSIRHIYMESRALKGLYNLYKDTYPSKALESLERVLEIEMQIHDQKATEMMQSFDVKYETLKKEHTISLQKQTIRTRNVVLILLTALLVLSCILTFLKAKAAKAMEQKNAILVKANLDKDRLLSLSRHNVPDEVKQEINAIVSEVGSMPQINLTKRELQIAELCSQGMLNKEIAAQLGISQRTVETHKNNLFRKLGINNTVELMRYMQKIQK